MILGGYWERTGRDFRALGTHWMRFPSPRRLLGGYWEATKTSNYLTKMSNYLTKTSNYAMKTSNYPRALELVFIRWQIQASQVHW